MDPILAAAILTALSQGIGGMQAGKASGASTEEQAREFDLLQGQKQQRRHEIAPVNDRLLYAIQARMGLPTQQFKPHDIFNESYGSGPAQMGGYDQNAYNDLMSKYQPGMGGVSGVGNNPDPFGQAAMAGKQQQPFSQAGTMLGQMKGGGNNDYYFDTLTHSWKKRGQ